MAGKKTIPQIIPPKEETLLGDEEELEVEEIEDPEGKTTYSDPMKAYLKELKLLSLLSVEEEKALAEKVKKGDKEARLKMIQANLRLVISVAKRYTNLGLPISDLIEEGNLGLMKAVDRYDTRRGYRFSTYAIWWIKQAVIRALASQGKTIRVPVYMVEIINRLRKTTHRLSQKLGRSPTDHELARAMKMELVKIRIIKEIIQNPSSLEKPVGDEGSGQLLNLIADDKNASPLLELASLLQHEKIMNLLKELPPRTAKIINLRYGLDGVSPHTLEETGRKFGITRERVRQIEESAMRKLKSHMTGEKKGITPAAAKSSNGLKVRQGGKKNDKRETKRKN